MEFSKKEELKQFFIKLKNADPGAIRELASKISYRTNQMVRQANFSTQDAEELVQDALVITITNIRKERFQFQKFTPTAYALGVVRKLIANKLRKRKLSTTSLKGTENLPDFSPEAFLQKKEREQFIGKLLHQLGETCQQILQLKYFEGYKDEEIIRERKTGFSNVNSLKVKRSQCMKQLRALARSQGQPEF